jgi:hypothetical protein
MSKLKVNNLEPLSGSVVSIASNLAVDGTLTAKVLKTELTQSAILYESGSTKFGDSPDDLHQFTGSVQLEGSFQASGQTNLLRFYFPNSGTLPPAGDWHGMLAHVHDEGNIQFAHGGSWVKLSNEADVTALSSSLDSKIDSEILALSSSTDAHLDAEILALSSSTDAHLDAEILALSSSADSQRIHYYSQSVIAAATDNLSLSGSAHDQRVHIGSSLSTDLTDVSSSLYSHISTNTAGIATEKARVDAILSSSVADTDSFAEIVTLINSVDTENDTAFAGYVTSSTSRMDGIDTTISTLSGSAHTQRVANKTELSNNITAVSSSFETTVGSLTDRVATNESDITDIQNNSLGYASTGSNEFIGDQRISGSLAVGYTSASIANVLTIAPTDPADFPPTAATGSLMVTTGGVLRYYDGTQWYNVVLA